MSIRQCVRKDGSPKMTYLTKQDAKKALRHVPGSPGTGWNSYYKCPECRYYHIGRNA